MDILYEDGALLVCEKPPEILSEPDGGGRDVITLLKEQTGAELFPVHRLDKGTGGSMVLAKTQECAAALSGQIQRRELEKEYLAIAGGLIQPEEGELADLLWHDAKRNKSFVVQRRRKGVREALLSYRLLAQTQTDDGPVSLMLVRLRTGRTHQIRVQFASRGLPLLGDARYGGRRGGRIALWSFRLTFDHPFTGEKVRTVSLPPAEEPWTLFADELERLRAKKGNEK